MDNPASDLRAIIKLRLLDYQRYERQGIVRGLRMSKAGPWPPALEMRRLRDEGKSVEEIARQLDYSPKTVERNLITAGIDPRVGPQCDRFEGRVFTVEEALREMPLPCKPDCICQWTAMLASSAEIFEH